jgi:hypothetical protein
VYDMVREPANELVSTSRKEETGDWYNYDHIDERKCQYNVIFGERSNGKTYGALKKILEKLCNEKRKGCLYKKI